ncbi:MAG: Ig-like domain-containing protein, partial [Oscillospiraceae bacterium]|nr:Ig-like domain-containing protein [Oscillospiraceae bacterium]
MFADEDGWAAYYNDTYLKSPSITDVQVQAMPFAKVTDTTLPAGTYYSGQTVPITVTLDHYATATDGAKLMVNNVECPMLDAPGTVSKQFTFAYTVKAVDTGAVNVSGITGLDGMDPGFELTPKSFGIDEGVKLVSTVKQESLDMANVKYGISDETGAQTVTVLIPFKEGANVEWIGSESADCTTNGQGFKMTLPDYGETEIIDYLNGAYFSYDNGKTRYPAYVVRSTDGNETALALACRFAAPANETPYLRRDTVNLFMDTLTVNIPDSTKYLDTWAKAKKDAQGFAYFDGSSKTEAAPIWVGAAWSSYTLGCVAFEQDATTPRSTEEVDYTDKVENGWLTLDDGNYVLLNDPEHPENQYDVEIVANDALYKAITGGARAEDGDDLTLSLQFSGRKKFTFTNANDFTWQSSDESIATITVDENGVAHVELTGKPGDVTFTLTVGNGSEDKAYTLAPVSMNVLEGKTPFLNIPKYSQIRQTLTGIDTDVAFSSNVTARNAQLGKDTVFTVNVYRAAPVTGTEDAYNRTGEPIWTGSFTSTAAETLTHVTIPGSQLTSKGAYAVEISAEYVGGKIGESVTPKQLLSASAILVAKQGPASVSLNQLDSYYVTAGNVPVIGYTVSESATEVEYTIQKSGENVSDRIPVTGGVIPFTPTTPASLKEAYTITIYARNSADDDWSVDSMLLTVYNPNILHQIVSDVTAGQIGGTTGGTGKNVKGKTVQMDNHDKMVDYGVDEDGEYQLTFDDFTALRTDMSLQKIVSVNYGEGVWGMLSDKMMWESSDPSTVSVDYKQGGIYSDIRNYSYTSYAPATDFLMVGKKETGEGEKVTITATHANTGIQSSFDVTTTMLKDQLYVFRFVPAVKTDVIYTNGKGEKRTLSTNDNGELAVYEPDGIYEPVMARSEYDGRTWVGTLYPDDQISGERDVASLQ